MTQKEQPTQAPPSQSNNEVASGHRRQGKSFQQQMPPRAALQAQDEHR